MLAVALLTVAAVFVGQTEAEFRRVCYVSNWSQYRPSDGLFKPPNIDPTLCSHIVYAFATLDSANNISPFEWNDDGAGGLYEQLNAHKAANPDLKTILAIGGWNFGMDKVVIMLSSALNRQRFIDQSIAYCRSRNFDGFDLDFEYPGTRGSPPEDKDNFSKLVTEMRAAYDAEAVRTGQTKLILTSAVAAGKPNVEGGYDVPTVCRAMDWINLMSYDLNGAWDNITGINSPLYARSDERGNDRETLNVDWSAQNWVSKLCPKEKIVIGMGVYGRCFTLKDASVNGLGAPVIGSCKAGTYTREAGFLSYYEICELRNTPGAVTVYDEEQQVPYTYLGDQWVGYDDEKSLAAKVKYMMAGGFGGWMVWNIDLDDFAGLHCNAGKYPLLKTMNNIVTGGTVGTTTPYTGPSTTRPTTTTTAPAGSGPCGGKGNGLYLDPSTCAAYYNCFGGNGASSPCPGGLLFNPDNSACDWPASLSPARKEECKVSRRRR